MKNLHHKVDFCVVGGGLSGLCAALAAARQGVRVALIHDRPVLGGNASSEVRMWICGARGENLRETGIIEEIKLENLYRNPMQNYQLWDSVLYGLARYQAGLTLLLNCSCNQLQKNENRITTVTGWQSTSETWHTVEADLFADCSGDSVLAPLSGAAFRIGREASSEFNESIAPARSDRKTMGMSCLIQARQTDRRQPFIAPSWAYRYTSDQQLPNRGHSLESKRNNFWWIELGGEQDSIHDTEEIRDELVRRALGIWDHIKNHGDHGAENWILEWIGFLPGKRESRRYQGDHILTQNEVAAGGRFEDIVAYGGWPMDDHHPAGLNYPGEPTIFHPSPSPFGIPYRCLYSHNLDNLFCAGRNISATHAALSSTRVMATCAILGQAVGTAAGLAVKEGLCPRQLYPAKIERLQQLLLSDDCFLPGLRRQVPELTQQARLTATTGDPEPLRNGLDRPIGNQDNGWNGYPGAWLQYEFREARQISQLRLVCDSGLNRPHLNMPCSYPLDQEPRRVPETVLKKFRVEALDQSGNWYPAATVEANYQRLVKLDLELTTRALRLITQETWGSKEVHLFSLDIQ